MKHTVLVLALALAIAGCSRNDSEIGLGLQDPATLYSGTLDTLAVTACTVTEDSLNTTNYSQGLLGHINDPIFGPAEAIVYTQLANPAEGGLYFDLSVVDSCILSLSLSNPYPARLSPDGSPRLLPLEIARLAEEIDPQRTYYSFDAIEPDPEMTLFDGVVAMHATDTAVRIPLDKAKLAPLLEGRHFETNQQLIDALRGLRIRLGGMADQMYTLNFNASGSGLLVYHHADGEATTDLLSIGAGGRHFNQFLLRHTGPLQSLRPDNPLPGNQNLYLQPMGGTRIRLDLNASLQAFRQAHPQAVIHYAELQLPLTPGLNPESHPESLIAMKHVNDTLATPIPDMLDPIAASTLNYRYDPRSQSYRMRVTQHIQRLLRTGTDPGTYILINSRRSSPSRAVINGTDRQQPTQIVIVYTEL